MTHDEQSDASPEYRKEGRNFAVYSGLLALGIFVISWFQSDIAEYYRDTVYRLCTANATLAADCAQYADIWSPILTWSNVASLYAIVVAPAAFVAYSYLLCFPDVSARYLRSLKRSGWAAVAISVLGVIVAIIAYVVVDNGFAIPESPSGAELGNIHWEHSRPTPDIPALIHGGHPSTGPKSWYVA